jgi:hypothetical protein
LADGAVSADLRATIDAAVARLDADAGLLARALRSKATKNSDDVPLSVFAAIATARRHAFASFGTIRRLESTGPEYGLALMTFSILGSALGSVYRSLRERDPVAAKRERRLADERFAAATRVFADLDRALGCPYGCKKGG